MQRTRLATLLVLVLAVAVAAAGCGGGRSGSATTVAATPGQAKVSAYNDPSRFVLVEQDLPTGYLVDEENTRAITNADAAKGRDDSYLRQLLSWGRIAGYASGWRPGTADVQGPLQIQSSASTFETVGGAVDAYSSGLEEITSEFKEVDPGETIGEESRMWTRELDAANGPLTVYAMAWRSGQVLATIAVTSQKGGVSANDALAYAQKQEARIEEAAAQGLGK